MKVYKYLRIEVFTFICSLRITLLNYAIIINNIMLIIRYGARTGVDEFALHETTLRLSYAKLRQYGTWTKVWILDFGPNPILS